MSDVVLWSQTKLVVKGQDFGLQPAARLCLIYLAGTYQLEQERGCAASLKLENMQLISYLNIFYYLSDDLCVSRLKYFFLLISRTEQRDGKQCCYCCVWVTEQNQKTWVNLSRAELISPTSDTQGKLMEATDWLLLRILKNNTWIKSDKHHADYDTCNHYPKHTTLYST